MKDFTQKLAVYGEEKRNAETQRFNTMVEHIKEKLAYIEGRSEDLDMLVTNANAAWDAGIRLGDNEYNSHYDFTRGNFRANGICHRLGFVLNEPDWKKNSRIVGLAVIGGGCNGDVSIVYKDGKAFYETDKCYSFNSEFPDFLPLEDMDANLLNKYARAIETFVEDIDPFITLYERHLEGVLANAKR